MADEAAELLNYHTVIYKDAKFPRKPHFAFRVTGFSSGATKVSIAWCRSNEPDANYNGCGKEDTQGVRIKLGAETYAKEVYAPYIKEYGKGA